MWKKCWNDRALALNACIRKCTGRFPHWFRGVTENVYGKLIFKNDAWKLKEFMGLKRLDSTTDYVKGSWEEDAYRIYQV